MLLTQDLILVLLFSLQKLSSLSLVLSLMLFQVSHYLLLDDCENLQILLEINHSMSVNSEIERPACLLNSFLDLSLGMRLN